MNGMECSGVDGMALDGLRHGVVYTVGCKQSELNG